MSHDLEFLRTHPNIDVAVDFNDLNDDELFVCTRDVRETLSPQPGDVLVAGDWNARPAKVQVIEVTETWVRLRVLD